MDDRLEVGSDEMIFRVTSEESGGKLIAYEVAFAPGGGPPMLHRHDAFELIRVEAGELTICAEDEHGCLRQTVAAARTAVAIPGGREHTVRNLSDRDARAFAVLTPGAEMERFVRAAGALAVRGAAGSAEDLLAIAEANGVEVTRPLAEAL